MANKNMKRIHAVEVKHIEDCTDGDTIGISAVATISLLPPDSSNGVLLQHISSGDLWRIDTNAGSEAKDYMSSNAKYIHEVEQEQLDELRHVLHVLGLARRAITAAFRNVTRRGVE